MLFLPCKRREITFDTKLKTTLPRSFDHISGRWHFHADRSDKLPVDWRLRAARFILSYALFLTTKRRSSIKAALNDVFIRSLTSVASYFQIKAAYEIAGTLLNYTVNLVELVARISENAIV